mgnify:CR=1 FL=1
MMGQAERVETGLSGLALMALRAEMEALSLLMPGVFAPQKRTEVEVEAEDLFDDMPV